MAKVGKRKEKRIMHFDGIVDELRFYKDMVFLNKDEFKKALLDYGITSRRELRFVKKELNKAKVVYKSEGCPWKILRSLIGDGDFVVKTYE